MLQDHPDVAARVPDIGRIIAFRNILVHGYAAIDRRTVWRATESNLPELRRALATLIESG